MSNLTNDLNNSVITLKRRNLFSEPGVDLQYPKLNVSEDEINKANDDLILILTNLERFYQNPDIDNELFELKDNPLFKNQILNNQEFKHKILEALEKIKASKNLTNKDLSNIDKFISILDNETSVLYKKLRTNRG